VNSPSAANIESPQAGSAAVRRVKWWGIVGLVFAGQLGAIFWLGQKGPGLAATRISEVNLRWIQPAPEPLSSLLDPTLFALPHRQSFSGPAWMTAISLATNTFSWSEDPRYLDYFQTRVDTTLNDLPLTNRFSLVEAIASADVEPRLPQIPSSKPPREQSTWQLAGDLARRRLLTPLQLTSQSSDDLLTNTVVQLVVDARGWPFSEALLQSSNSKDADQQALALAATARFEPLRGGGSRPSQRPLDGLTWGELIFDWHTVPVPPTNAPSGTAK
jgi:hypothetical protein